MWVGTWRRQRWHIKDELEKRLAVQFWEYQTSSATRYVLGEATPVAWHQAISPGMHSQCATYAPIVHAHGNGADGCSAEGAAGWRLCLRCVWYWACCLCWNVGGGCGLQDVDMADTWRLEGGELSGARWSDCVEYAASLQVHCRGFLYQR